MASGLEQVGDHAQPVPGVENSGVPPVFAEHDAFAPSGSARFANPIRTGTERLLATMATHSWALASDPDGRDAAFAQVRAYLAERPETSSGDFVLPMTTEVLRALRR